MTQPAGYYKGIAYTIEVLSIVLGKIEADTTMSFKERLASSKTIHAINEILMEQLNDLPSQPPE